MFKPGDKIRHRLYHDHQYTVDYVNGGYWRTRSGCWIDSDEFELLTPANNVNHLRTICEKMRSVAGPQGRFWIREVFEQATGEKME
jgi:hypothetical protein